MTRPPVSTTMRASDLRAVADMAEADRGEGALVYFAIVENRGRIGLVVSDRPLSRKQARKEV